MVGELFAVEHVEDAHTSLYLHDLVQFHPQGFRQFDVVHQVDEVLRVRTLPDLQLHAETVDQQFDQRLVVDLELHSFVQQFLDEYFQFDAGAVFGQDELFDHFVELFGVAVEIAELVEQELLSLSVFEEEEGDEVFGSELHEFLSGEAASAGFVFAEVVFQHEFVHRRVELHCFVGFSCQFVTDRSVRVFFRRFVVVFEYLEKFGRGGGAVVVVGVDFVGVLANF